MTGPPFISRALDLLVRRVAAGLKIPEPALRMFRTANELSGLDRKTLPTELIPLNTIQISRGLLNFTLLQSLEGWVFPYWADRQYDPADPGFIPRSHLGLSMNVTRRNWTAVGSPSCSTEPVVDPRGAVMPFRNGWTSECWLRHGETVWFPSLAPNVVQRLHDGLPVVTTTYECGELRMDETVFVNGTTLILEASVTNTGGAKADCTFAFAVRPFNAEGACLLGDIAFDSQTSAFAMNGNERLLLPGMPASVHCSNHKRGDSADAFAHRYGSTAGTTAATCPSGLANGYAAYDFTLAPGETKTFRARVCLGEEEDLQCDADQAAAGWNALLDEGTEIVTPDEHVNSLVRASVSTLLLLTDGDSITPGPWTYHQFWFRDAAIMLRALDAYGFHSQVRAVIGSFPSLQERSGYFRSQQGEWDSNGEALWTVWQHAVLAGEASFGPDLEEALKKGALWIARKRREDPEKFPGLMPPGLSAEHLGLSDRYFWDNWWSAAGLEAYARLSRLGGRKAEEESARSELAEYREDTERAVTSAGETNGIDVIPAGPERGIDCGMIGSCAPWYPLQLYPPHDERMRRTLEALEDRFFHQGLFFQEFIHSGMNPYLTLQIAQAWLYAGERERFWRLCADVFAQASPTLNYPEAIHPLTGGGTMGDGHHGWAAAEIALAMRSAFVRETWTADSDTPRLVLLGGIPRHWFLSGGRFAIRRAPVPGGVITLDGVISEGRCALDIDFEKLTDWGAEEWNVQIPGEGSRVTVNGGAARSVALCGGETSIVLTGAPGRTHLSVEIAPPESAP